ncbi:MAG: tRNA (adenosine(37)-N6)-threonylcarbamoyltransferase complex ATPase subunit type 1 TsaE [Dehalococcoidia bacterium]
MSEQHAFELTTHSETETRELGTAMAGSLRRGDVILLSGDLGTGKTCLTQGIGAGLECSTQVSSPSFVLMNEYQGRERLFHVDLYRVKSVEELDDLGLWDYAEQGVLVIEWPEKGADLLPGDGIVVELRYGDLERERRFTFLPQGPRGAAVIEALAGE